MVEKLTADNANHICLTNVRTIRGGGEILWAEECRPPEEKSRSSAPAGSCYTGIGSVLPDLLTLQVCKARNLDLQAKSSGF